MAQCTARSKRSGVRCKNDAVIGYTVCRMHGAGNRIQGTKGGRPVEHGMYSNKVNTKLEELYQDFLDDNDNVDALNQDIALMRAMMVASLQEETTKDNKHDQANTMLRFMRDIRYAIELKDDIESKYMVSIDTVKIFLNQILFILKKNIKDEDVLQAVVMEMKQIKLLDQEMSTNTKQLRDSKKRR